MYPFPRARRWEWLAEMDREEVRLAQRGGCREREKRAKCSGVHSAERSSRQAPIGNSVDKRARSVISACRVFCSISFSRVHGEWDNGQFQSLKKNYVELPVAGVLG